MNHPGLFLLAAVTLIAIPGPNHLYIAARAIGGGRGAGIASAMGVETGTLVHVAAAAAGLSAVIAASSTAFTALRYAGAAYLVYLAIRTLRSRDDGDGPEPAARSIRRAYMEGILVNVTNPKVVLLFLAFLPQFVDRDAGAVPAQMAVMGLALTLIGLVTDMSYAVAAGSIGGWLRARPLFRRRQRFATGAVYLGLGAVTLLAGAGGGTRRA